MDRIPYDVLVQRAIREVVVREALNIAARPEGLPGQNHIYISFRTQAAGVTIPKELVAQYPDVMTIVLQNEYRDLEVGDTSFSVGLTFGGVPARLTIPLGAITRFQDPAAGFGVELVPTVDGLRSVEEEDVDAHDDDDLPPDDEPSGDAQVLSLDQFRRK